MAQTWTQSKVTPVYYRVGKFDNDQMPRFIKAPFDLITIDGKQYLQPSTSGYGSQATAQSVSADAEQARLCRQPGGFYTDITPVVIDEHEMGCSEDSLAWKGMHKFGWV